MKKAIHWDKLPDKQFGTYVEYLAKLYFIQRGDDVYLPEIDNKGIDFVVRRPTGRYLEIQVRGRRKPPPPKPFNYFFIEKSTFPMKRNRWMFLALYSDRKRPHGDYYLIPVTAWKKPNALFKDYKYDTGQKSPPEWGLNLQGSYLHLLNPYRIKNFP